MTKRTGFIATAALLLLAACNSQGGQNEASTADTGGNGGETMNTSEGLIPGENTMGNVAGAAGNAAEDVGNVAGNAANSVSNTVGNATTEGNTQ
jgi:protein involved in sex pheromone biosynthesis